MSDAAGSTTTAGIEIPRVRDGFLESDGGIQSDGAEPGGLATPPNTPLSTSLNPNTNSLLSKSWFAEQFHRQMMIHNSQSGLTESTERAPPSPDNQSLENSNGVTDTSGNATGSNN